MSIKHKITALACASALALSGAAPAFAAEGDTQDIKSDAAGANTADVQIDATVAKEGEKIISVTVPSTMGIAITTYKEGDANAGQFKEATTATATVYNNAASTADVKVELTYVSQTLGVDQGAKLLDLVNLGLTGEFDDATKAAKKIALAEGAVTDGTLFSRIAPKGDGSLNLVAEKNGTKVIPTDAYTVKTTLKVSALDPVTI